MCNYCNSGCGNSCGCGNSWVGLLNIFTAARCNSCYDAYYAAQYGLDCCNGSCSGCSSAGLYNVQSNCNCGCSGFVSGTARFFTL